jgi:co-chaperonin GroES (HSP10)
MIQAAYNNIFVEVEHKAIRNISSIAKISSIENNSSVNLEDAVNIVGTIVSIPKKVSEFREYKGFSLDGINIGDKAIFSHSVIAEMYLPNPESDWLYKNRIWIDGKELFAVDITRLFAVISNNNIRMVNGYVMLTPHTDRKLILPPSMRKIKGCVTSDIMHIGEPQKHLKKIDAQQGDTVYYSPFKVTKYQINNKPYLITQQHHILGRCVY